MNDDYQARLIQARRAALWREVDRVKRQERRRAAERSAAAWHGHRRDQVVFSALVLAALTIVGLALGAALAVWETIAR